jgi:LysR family transcriptional regulator, glycine cleavage system transcriptional activator
MDTGWTRNVQDCFTEIEAPKKIPKDRRALPPFAALRAFEAVGRLGGIRKAAQELQVDHAVVSRHLRSLEAAVARPLVDRSGTFARLNADALKFHSRISNALAEISAATYELRNETSANEFVIWCAPGFAARWLAGRLHHFHSTVKDVEIELRPTDSSPDFSRKDADGDIRFFPDISPPSVLRGVSYKELARPPVFPVASPAWIAARPTIQDSRALLNIPLLHENENEWRGWFTAQGIEVKNALKGPRLWHAHITVDAARRGEGVALANPFLIEDDLETGRLVRIGGDKKNHFAVSIGAYYLMLREDLCHSTSILRFADWIQKATAKYAKPGPKTRTALQKNTTHK